MHLVMQRAYFGDLCVRGHPAGRLASERLDHAEDIEFLGDVRRTLLRSDRAALGQHDDESVARQFLRRFPLWCARHIQPFGKRAFARTLAGFSSFSLN
ncbi:hypothetical protein AWB67_07592 [Caballeronia terrestris]|uniref:Uncharacterized protein n=1 Tax=Caballeronia terrestris TaxID=1226301 RepID=A0A158L6A1_9BURK|nr:hypothetical protein AWB67_07592 [Caballeronia terrestris]